MSINSAVDLKSLQGSYLTLILAHTKKIKDLWLTQDENGLKSVSCRMQLLVSLITIFDQVEGH